MKMKIKKVIIFFLKLLIDFLEIFVIIDFIYYILRM